MPEPEVLATELRPALLDYFKPAFLGRTTIVPYYPLGDDVIKSIIRLQLGRIGKRLKENHRAEFIVDDGVVDAIRNRCREVESGARNVDHILTGTLLPEISREFLARMAAGDAITSVRVSVKDDGQFAYEIV